MKSALVFVVLWQWLLLTAMTSAEETEREGAPDENGAVHRAESGASALYNCGVCITGQMQRLELQSKIDRLLRPNHDVEGGGLLDIVFSLSNYTDPLYSNSITHGGGGALGMTLSRLKPQRKANTYEAVHEAVSGFARHVMWSTAEPLDVIYNENYNNLLAQSHAPQNYTLSKSTRVRSQITTWYHMRRCYDEFLNIESRESFMYDYFVHVREDAFLLRPLSPLQLVPLAAARGLTHPEDKVLVHGACGDHGMGRNGGEGGMLNSGAMFRRSVAYTYFFAPLDDYYLFWHERMSTAPLAKGELMGPQRFLQRAYEHRNVTLVASTAAFPVVNSLPISPPSKKKKGKAGKLEGSGESDSGSDGPIYSGRDEVCLLLKHRERQIGCYSQQLDMPTSELEALLCAQDAYKTTPDNGSRKGATHLRRRA